MADSSPAYEALKLAAAALATVANNTKEPSIQAFALGTFRDAVAGRFKADAAPAPSVQFLGPFSVGESDEIEGWHVQEAMYDPDNGQYRILAHCPDRADAEAIVRTFNELRNIKAGIARHDADLNRREVSPTGDDYNEVVAIVMQGGEPLLGKQALGLHDGPA